MLAPAADTANPLSSRGEGDSPAGERGEGAREASRRALAQARHLTLLVPAALLAGAWGFQLLANLPPCEMCHWQRWGHYAALALALVSFAVPKARLPVLLAALAILASGAVGAFHAGVEYGWWQGITRCTGAPSGSIADILATPLVRCDVAAWSLAGISMAGWNALISLVTGAAALWLTLRR